MLSSKQLDKIMFFAIETVPVVEKFTDLSPTLQECFKQKFKHELEKRLKGSNDAPDVEIYSNEIYQEKAALIPEFAKIAAISWGGIRSTETWSFGSNQLSSDNEKELLITFADKLNKIKKDKGTYEYSLCGYANKGFNIPFLAKRMLVNRIEIPAILDMENLKPWEQSHVIDLSAEWKMGQLESYTSLETLCALFDVDYSSSSPEAVKKAYYAKNHAIVGDSCETKLVSLANAYLRLKNINNKLTIQIK